MKTVNEIRPIKQSSESDLLKRKGVTGVDIGQKIVGGKKTDELSIRVYVKEKKDVPASEKIPKEINGVKTDVVQRIFKLHPLMRRIVELEIKSDTGTYDPIKGGISIGPCRSIWKEPPEVEVAGNYVFVGTLGAMVKDNATGNLMMLSNFHVMCVDNTWSVGDNMTQPSRVDGGACPGGIVGTLQRASLGGQVDCAVANHTARGYSCSIVDIGKVYGKTNAAVGQKVRKRGRTTGLTYGTVDTIDLTVSVDYGDGLGTVTLTNQIGIDVDATQSAKFGDNGDSGSVVVNEDNKVIGLYFAGNDDGTYGAANPIQAVLDALNVKLCVPIIKKIETEPIKKFEPDGIKKIEHEPIKKIEHEPIKKTEPDAKIKKNEVEGKKFDWETKKVTAEVENIRDFTKDPRTMPRESVRIQEDQAKKYEPDDIKKREPDYKKQEPDNIKKYEPDYKKREPDYKKLEPDYKKREPDYKKLEPDIKKIESEPIIKTEYEKISPEIGKGDWENLKLGNEHHITNDFRHWDYTTQPYENNYRNYQYQDAQAKKQEPDNIKKNEPDYKKQEPDNIKKQEPDNIKKYEPDNIKKYEPDHKKREPDYKKLEPDYKKREPDIEKIEPENIKMLETDPQITPTTPEYNIPAISAAIEERLNRIEAALAQLTHFIQPDLRPETEKAHLRYEEEK